MVIISLASAFESLNTKFIFGIPVYLERLEDKFVYEGHRVKVTVTGSKNRVIR